MRLFLLKIKDKKKVGESMIYLPIPGFGEIKLQNLVLDYNGTIALDGRLIDGVGELLKQLSKSIDIFVITADTFGTVEKEMKDLPVRVIQINRGNEKEEKLQFIKQLGPNITAAIGNGNNDEFMLKEASIGICIMAQEGCSEKTLQCADLVIHDIKKALELFLYKNRLIATLRY